MGRVLVEYRTQWWRRAKDEPPPRPSRTGTIWFPHGELVLQQLADQLRVPGYNRQALSACLAYAHRHPTSVTLPRHTAWTVVKMGCGKVRQKRRRTSGAATAVSPEALCDLLWGVLPEAVPGCHVYQDRAAASTLGRSDALVQTMAGDVFAVTISITGSKQPSADRGGRPRSSGSQVPAVELRIGADLRRAKLVWLRPAPSSWRLQLDGATWLRVARRRATTDSYDVATER